jgi:hypothetical protein
LATKEGIEGVSSADGSVRYRVANGALTADGGTVLATEAGRLVVRDARTGTVTQSVAVGAGLTVSTISPDGSSVALSPAPASSYLPPGRTQTTIVIVRLPAATVMRYDLAGNLAADAFSTDDRGLFLASYLPPESPDRYQITSLDLVAGEVNGIFGRQKEALEDMRGRVGTKVLAPDHTTIYTLYLRPPGQAALGSDGTRAEVHTLKLDQGWAYCVDLPPGFGGSDLATSALAVSSDGTRLYAVDRALHQLVEIDTTGLTITRTVDLPFREPAAPTSMVVGSEGRIYVSDGPTVLVIGADTLAVVDRWRTPGSVTGLAVAGDGRGVAASIAQRVDVLGTSGGIQASIPAPADATAIRRILT